jgi:hypothetical protein
MTMKLKSKGQGPTGGCRASEKKNSIHETDCGSDELIFLGAMKMSHNRRLNDPDYLS